MEAAYPLPRHQTPLPRPARKTPAAGTRESNALRASVLDAALQLGIGNNALFSDWMFNESIQEGDEEPVSSPGLTYGSSATSEESSSSALTPSSSHSPNPSHLKAQPFGLHFPSQVIEEETSSSPISPSGGATVGFVEPPRPTTPAAKGKLRKKTKGDGYESDAGYVSEGGKRKDKKDKEKKKKDKDKAKDQGAETSAKPIGETDRTSAANSVPAAEPEERKRKKSLVSVMRGSKKSAPPPEPAGYDTDGGAISTSKSPSKSKSKKWKSSKAETDADYETDASASSKKSKSRFFKLGGKSSKANLKEPVPALPAFPDNREPMPLPIAERFATTLNTSNDATTSTTPSSANSPNSASLLPSLDFKSFTHSTEDSVSSNATWNTGTTSTTYISSAPTSSSNPTGRFNGIRDSQASASAESSSSHSHPSRGVPLSASSTREGAYPSSPIGNISRSTTPVSPSKQGSSFLPRAFSPLPGSNNTRATSPSPAMRMNPPISFPLTRALSPPPGNPTSPSESQGQSNSPPSTFVSPPPTGGLRVKPSLENLNLLAVRNTQPSQLSPSSPYVVVTPLNIRSAASSPALNGTQQQEQQSKLSPAPQFPARMTRAASPMRIKPGDALYLPLPRSPAPGASASAGTSPVSAHPNSGGNPQYLNVYPNGLASGGGLLRRDSQLSILSSSEYIVPSNRNSPLPSPNTLAYYDIPPPSPPPMGPLPSVPININNNNTNMNTSNMNMNNSNILPSPAALRQRVIDRSVRQLPEGFAAPIQRGKESPFPSRPVLSPLQQEGRQVGAGIGSLAGGPGGERSGSGGSGGVGSGIGGGIGSGIGSIIGSVSGAAARKYRDVYPRSESPAHELIKEQAEKRRMARLRPKRSVHFDDDVLDRDDDDEDEEGGEGDYERYDEVDEEEREELRGVLDRFEMNVQGTTSSPGLDNVDSPISATMGRRRSDEETFSRSQIPSPIPDLHRPPSNIGGRIGSQHEIPVIAPSPPPGAAPAASSASGRSSEDHYSRSHSHSPPPIDDTTIPDADIHSLPHIRPRAREPLSEYTMGDRTSRWSGSVYSRNSILDEEESETTRGRFIDRVKKMLSEKDGSGVDYRGQYVPPVPRLPDAYSSSNGNGNSSGNGGAGASSTSRWGRF